MISTFTGASFLVTNMDDMMITPLKFNMVYLKRRFLLETLIFSFHVKLWGCSFCVCFKYFQVTMAFDDIDEDARCPQWLVLAFEATTSRIRSSKWFCVYWLS